MNVYFYVLFLALLLYAYMIDIFFAGWRKMPLFIRKNNPVHTKISVVVAMRDEEKNIPMLLECLQKQNFPMEFLDIILVDDDSADATVDFIRKFLKENKTAMRLLEIGNNQNEAYGKKAALAFAIKHSTADLIVCTDADCTMDKNWLLEIVSFYEEFRPSFISGPVCFHHEKTLFEKIQSLEFLGLVGTGAASIGLNIPVMCNGANLAFERSMYLEVGGYSGHEGISSGDDMFLMMEIYKRSHSKVMFLKSPEAIVFTKAQSTASEFFHQRKRWASKNFSKVYVNAAITGGIVLVTHLLLIGGFILLFFNPKMWILFLCFLSLKMITNFFFLSSVASFFKKKYLLYLLLPGQLFFVFYSIGLMIVAPFITNKWKRRKVR